MRKPYGHYKKSAVAGERLKRSRLFYSFPSVIINSKVNLSLQVSRCTPQNSAEVANFPLCRRFLPEMLIVHFYSNIKAFTLKLMICSGVYMPLMSQSLLFDRFDISW